MIVALVNIGSETEQIEYKKSIGELKEAVFSIAAILKQEISGIRFVNISQAFIVLI